MNRSIKVILSLLLVILLFSPAAFADSNEKVDTSAPKVSSEEETKTVKNEKDSAEREENSAEKLIKSLTDKITGNKEEKTDKESADKDGSKEKTKEDPTSKETLASDKEQSEDEKSKTSEQNKAEETNKDQKESGTTEENKTENPTLNKDSSETEKKSEPASEDTEKVEAPVNVILNTEPTNSNQKAETTKESDDTAKIQENIQLSDLVFDSDTNEIVDISTSGDYVLNTNTHKIHRVNGPDTDQISEANREEVTDSLVNLYQNGNTLCENCFTVSESTPSTDFTSEIDSTSGNSNPLNSSSGSSTTSTAGGTTTNPQTGIESLNVKTLSIIIVIALIVLGLNCKKRVINR